MRDRIEIKFNQYSDDIWNKKNGGKTTPADDTPKTAIIRDMKTLPLTIQAEIMFSVMVDVSSLPLMIGVISLRLV